MVYEFLISLYYDLITIARGVVVKRADLAQAYETKKTAEDFELYHACVIGSRYFYNFSHFDRDILSRYMDYVNVDECEKDPNNIPESLRAGIVEDQAQRVIETYEEKNNYYRMLNGLPDVEDTDFIYVRDVDGIPDNVPIHLLSFDHINKLDASGKIYQIISDNPTKQYLKFLGYNKIDIIKSRLARPFDLLSTGTPNNSKTLDMFQTQYYSARRYVMATMYHKEYFGDTQLYDPIMGVIILTLAIRNCLVPNSVEYINFEEILDSILESYGLYTYFRTFPPTYKRRLVLALDKILRVKGTDGVLVDICRLFSFDNFTANRYYLLKTQNKDSEGHLIFSNDPNEQYKLSFVKSNIEEQSIDYNEDNRIEYDVVVDGDYLWQLTEEEKNHILNTPFNRMMTKYIDIEAAYDLTELTFEVCYFINMMLQHRDMLSKFTVANTYSPIGTSTVYAMLIFLLCAMSRLDGYDGNIVYDSRDIAQILRFNYETYNTTVNELIQKYKDRVEVPIDFDIVPGYNNTLKLDFAPSGSGSSKLVEAYVNNRVLYNAILEEMHNTNDINYFITLRNIKESMFISAMQHEQFMLTNGDWATNFYDLLLDIDPGVYYKLIDFNSDRHQNELNTMVLYILDKLEGFFDSDQFKYLFLNTPNIYSSVISKYLRTAINVFKANAVQLTSINVFLEYGDHKPIRVIDDAYTETEQYINDSITPTDSIVLNTTLTIDDYINVADSAYDVN